MEALKEGKQEKGVMYCEKNVITRTPVQQQSKQANQPASKQARKQAGRQASKEAKLCLTMKLKGVSNEQVKHCGIPHTWYVKPYAPRVRSTRGSLPLREQRGPVGPASPDENARVAAPEAVAGEPGPVQRLVPHLLSRNKTVRCCKGKLFKPLQDRKVLLLLLLLLLLLPLSIVQELSTRHKYSARFSFRSSSLCY